MAAAGAKAASDGTAALYFSDKFLLAGGSAALPTGDHAYTMRYTIGNTTYEAPMKPTVGEAPPEAQDQQIKKDLELSPFNDSIMYIGVSFPKGWPIVGGNKVKLWQPSLPFNISYDPFGFIRIQAITPPLGYINDFGESDESHWKLCTRDSAKEQFDKLKMKMADQATNTFGALAKDGRVKQIGFSNKLSFTVQLELMAAATWEFGDEESRGRAQIALCFDANYSLTETFWAGPFPVVIRFGIGLNGRLAALYGARGRRPVVVLPEAAQRRQLLPLGR